MLLCSLEDALPHVEAEGIVLERHRDLQRLRIAAVLLRHFGGDVHGVAQVVVRGGENREQVFVAFGEELARRAVPLHVRDLVLLGHRRDGFRQPGAVRAEHELHAVLVDEPLGELRSAGRRGFVVVIEHLQLVRFSRDLHAAHLVDAFHREVIAVLGVLAIDRVLAGERHGRAEDDGVAFDLGGGAPHRGQQQQCARARCGEARQGDRLRHVFSSRTRCLHR